jgi:2-deoxy-scyllo-inosamine dehydrogenase (SAM-dependent)
MTNAKMRRWPSVVEIEVNSRCNRRCVYCPNSLPDRPKTDKFMDVGLFKKIIGELAAIEFSGRLSFHFFNEPLVRRDLEALVAWARAQLPWAYLVLFTNGDLLDDRRHADLLEAGLDHFLVTRHDFDSYPERPFQFVQLPSNFTLSGRGGTIAHSSEPLDIACFGPSEMMIVTINGDVVLCHEDAERRHVMGTLAVQSLPEIWFSDRFQAFREPLERGDRGAAGLMCGACDNRLYPVPGAAI